MRNWNSSKELETPDTAEVKEVEKRTKKERSGYVAVRGITYERVKPRIRVEPGEDVPEVILNDTSVFKHFCNKGVIKKR